jgi:BirA family transcriptional regulator, biotin operon repressor / biotin---[acetyl-CoA-carboxylase] ligase
VVAEPERTGLPPAELRRAVLVDGGLWTALDVVEETGSTNVDVIEAARAGAAEGLVLVAEHQRAGRGRAGRHWSSPPRAGLSVSVLLRPRVPAARWGWLPLLAGVALAESVDRVAGVAAALKWPNDLLVGDRKCAGILAEAVAGAVVVGIGLNVTLRTEELPAPEATSLALAGARTTDRAVLLVALLHRMRDWYERWQAAGGDADASGLRPAYLRSCRTVGSPVRVRLPDGSDLAGTAETVDPEGRLVVRTPERSHLLAAGDVTHVLPGCGGGGQALR